MASLPLQCEQRPLSSFTSSVSTTSPFFQPFFSQVLLFSAQNNVQSQQAPFITRLIKGAKIDGIVAVALKGEASLHF